MRIFLCLVMALVPLAGMASPVLVDEKTTAVELGRSLSYWNDAGGTGTIEEVLPGPRGNALRWEQSTRDALGFGLANGAWWFRCTLRNTSRQPLSFFLQQRYPLIDRIDCYLPEGGGYRRMTTGDGYPFAMRPVRHRTFLFPLRLAPLEEKTIYLRYRSESSLLVSLALVSPAAFEESRDRETRFLWMHYGFLVIILFYHLFVLISSRDSTYFYYVLYIISLLLFIMGQNGTAYEYLWPGSVWFANYSVPFFMGMTAGGCVQFARRFVGRGSFPRWVDALLLYFALANVLAGLSAFLLNNYRFSILLSTILVFITVVVLIPVSAYTAIAKRVRAAEIMLGSFALFFVGVLLYILKTWSLVPENFVTTYGMQIGAAIQVALISFGLEERLHTARRELARAEHKYRNLVESSGDIIFTLDLDGRFLMVNRAMFRHLGYDEEYARGLHVADIVHDGETGMSRMYREMLEEYIGTLRKGRGSVSFKATLRARYTGEPRDFSVTLEYTEIDGRPEILGKAAVQTEDAILHFLEAEKHVYTVGNYLGNAEFLSHHLTRNLAKYLAAADLPPLRLCLREILLNAIEHGNLNLTFEEKTGAMEQGNYLQFIRERQEDRRFRDRKVVVEYLLDREMLAYRVTDQGEGFDYRRYMKADPEKVNRAFLTHGRGLLMIREVFDVVRFNEKGNQVTLIKYFQTKEDHDTSREPNFDFF